MKKIIFVFLVFLFVYSASAFAETDKVGIVVMFPDKSTHSGCFDYSNDTVANFLLEMPLEIGWSYEREFIDCIGSICRDEENFWVIVSKKSGSENWEISPDGFDSYTVSRNELVGVELIDANCVVGPFVSCEFPDENIESVCTENLRKGDENAASLATGLAVISTNKSRNLSIVGAVFIVAILIVYYKRKQTPAPQTWSI